MENKTVWFLENKNQEWLSSPKCSRWGDNPKFITKDTLEAYQFKEEVDAKIFLSKITTDSGYSDFSGRTNTVTMFANEKIRIWFGANNPDDFTPTEHEIVE